MAKQALLYDSIEGWDRSNIHDLTHSLVQKLNLGFAGGLSGYSAEASSSIDSYCYALDAFLRQLGWTDDMFKPDVPVNPPNGAPKPPGHYIWELYK